MTAKVFIQKALKRIEMAINSKFRWRHFGGKKNLTAAEGNELLKKLIEEGTPLAVIRMGFGELDVVYKYNESCKYPKYNDITESESTTFFSSSDSREYCELIYKAYKNADVITNWYSTRNEEVLLKMYAPSAQYTKAEVVEPYYYSDPWSVSLKGKKVLIISPFIDEIKAQYAKRDKLFSREILPEMELVFIKSIWFCGAGHDERFENWFLALDYLKEEIDKVTFDIALLSCGPFGTPLVSYIKEKGKQAVYIGGALQILFGIKGSRWDNNPFFKNMYNDYWIRLGESSKPDNPNSLDKGCYW